MMRILTTLSIFALSAGPALAAGDKPLFSLKNTDFVVALGFIVFLGVLVYFKVPSMLGKMLDDRADGIRKELDDAKSLREEAQALLASYERKQKEVQDQADRIVEAARAEAAKAAEDAKEEIKSSVARRLAAAEDQIKSAEETAVAEVRNRAITVAIGAAQDVVGKNMTAASANSLIDSAIADVDAKLH